jgi:hypothetical protein
VEKISKYTRFECVFRKTQTLVSFAEKVRQFGDDAVPHQGKYGSKAKNYTRSEWRR